MDNSRRKFLKLAGASVLGVGALSAVDVLRSPNVLARQAEKDIYKQAANAIVGERWGMVVDTRKLDHEVCEKIIEACHSTHNVPHHEEKRHEIKWIWESEYKHVFPDQEEEYLVDRLQKLPIPVLCNQCANPPCVQACPTQATFQREDGIVMMDFHRCIGCRFCMAACPYGSRSFNFRDPRPAIKHENKEFPTRMKGVVEKCNFCAELLAVGKQPACVNASDGALVFGDLEDPSSEIRQLLKENYAIRRKVSLGTNPSVYYIV
jgi:molybdopterin-containing oxidoreductase family iron-sulfur binding subunit